MNYKMQGAIKKNKKNFIIYAVLWVIITIVLVVPWARAVTEASINGQFNMGLFFDTLFSNITNVGGNLSVIFTANYIGTFFSTLLKFSLVYLIIMIVGLVKMAPKTEYADIEHGSSDWSQNGEQFRILSNKKGIILAEGNYLPTNKRGNVNVLVVGRIWIW